MNQEILQKATELRHELHRHPELSGQERETKKRLMDFLRENTTLRLTDCGQWFYAEYHPQNPKPGRTPIAFRADFDAIKVLEETPLPYRSENPGVAHKCGHDGHSASLCAFAMDIEQKGADRDVYFLFQHAEETGAGAEVCAALLEEKGIAEVYGAHNFPGYPFGSLGLREGTVNCASKGMELIFTGASAHASQPEKGKNPARAISKTVLALSEIASPQRYAGLILATVVQVDIGERAFGVAAHKGRLLLTLRGQREEELAEMERELMAFAKKQAEEDGLEIAFAEYDVFPETYNHKESVDKIRRIAAEKNWPVTEMEAPIRSSEDFGYFTKKAPGALVWIGDGENWPPLHSEDFDFNDHLIEHIGELFRALTDA